MTADFQKILNDFNQKDFAPVYFVDGEESYYIDLVTHLFKTAILAPHDADFNLIELYGREVNWADVVNACRRFPMFSEKQVVILHDAAQLKELDNLISYLENPMPSTILLIEHRFKKLDGRGKMNKVVKARSVYFTSEKVKDMEMPKWIRDFGKTKNWTIGQAEAETIASFLGNDLQEIANELDKIRLNAPDEKLLSAELIKKYIGASRDYNIFDLPNLVMSKDKEKLYRMTSYFINNPKSAPMPLLIGTFYGTFHRQYLGYFQPVNAYNKPKVPLYQLEEAILLLAAYSRKAVGINATISDASLIKELIGKLELIFN